MKEIWKLIELLNEYEKEVKKSEFYEWEKWVWWDTNLFRRDTRDEEWSHLYSDTADTYVISKKYGFIWWLVENDKIDFRKLDYKNIYMSDYWSSDDIFLAYNKWEQWIIYTVDYYETILMLLSISDTPIEDLISYLK